MSSAEYDRRWRSRQPKGWKSWDGMKDRCLNPKSKDYARYGGRGITIHPSWLNFGNFFADMGERPDGTSIERIDNSKGYEPGNCRWATIIEQQNNRRSNRRIEYKGRKQTVAQWARELGWSRQMLRHRLESGWSIENALNVKCDYSNCKKNFQNASQEEPNAENHEAI